MKNMKNIELEEEDYYKPVKLGNFGVIIILIIKVTVTEIKKVQLKNMLLKLDRS